MNLHRLRFSQILSIISCAVFLITGVIPSAIRPAMAADAPKLTIGTLDLPTSLDPALARDPVTISVMNQLYTGLTRQTAGSLEFTMALASGHTVSTDGLTHSFSVRNDAAFNDGTPITAQTFADSINRAKTLLQNAKVTGANSPFANIQAVTVSTANEVMISLTRPLPYLTELLALPQFFPVDGRVFKPDQANNAPTGFASNGAYRLDTFTPRQSLTLTADTTYKGKPPATATIVLTNFAEPAALREAIKAHQVDIAWRNLPIDFQKNAILTDGIRLESAPSLQAFYAILGVAQKPFNDPKARAGFQYFFDRDTAVSSGLAGAGESLLSLVPPTLDASAPTYPVMNIDKGKATLKDGGYSDFKQVMGDFQFARLMYGDTHGEAVGVLQAFFRRQKSLQVVGADTEPTTFQEQIQKGEFRMIIVGWTPLVAHPYAYLSALVASDGTLAKAAHYSNPAVDDALTTAALNTNPQESAALMDEAQRLAAQDVVVIPLWTVNQNLLAWKNVGGVSFSPNFVLWLDQLTIQN